MVKRLRILITGHIHIMSVMRPQHKFFLALRASFASFKICVYSLMDTGSNLTTCISLFALAAEKLRATFAAHLWYTAGFFLEPI